MSIFYAERAGNGAAWLDEAFPGWHKKINLEKLDIECDDNCVIGQLFGCFNTHLVDDAKYSWHFIMNNGFHCKHEKYLNFIKLTSAWRNEVERRLAA